MSSGSKSKSVTVGYRYYMGLHFGICHGPVDSLMNIEIGTRAAWSGNQTSNGAIYINQPTLFGGDKREGGIQGTLDVMLGGSTQGTNSYLASKQGTPQPAYRGLLTAVYNKGLIAANNPYIKDWAFRVRRILYGWGNDATAWYSAKAAITLADGNLAMNPAHIVYQVLTDPTWGMGYDPGLIDTVSFTAAADKFYSEGLGLCIAWTKQTSIQVFLQNIIDHAGAAVGQDRRTGKFVLNAVRATADPSSLKSFDESNVISLDSFQRTSLAETINEVTVAYVDVTNGKTATVTVQNLANIQAQGGVVAQTKEYPGIPNYALAVRVAERDLRATSTPVAKYKFKTNRAAYNILPGDAIKFSWAKLGIVNTVLRVLKLDYGDLENGTITIEASEDIYDLPLASYVQQQQDLWVAPSTAAVGPSYYDLKEATFQDLASNLGHTEAIAVPATSGYAVGVAARPSGVNMNYELWTKVGAADYALAASGDWSPNGTLTNSITPATTSISLSATSDLEYVTVPALAYIENEIVRIDAIDASASTATIARGCSDTVAASHAAGARVWFYDLLASVDTTEYTNGETVYGKFRTITTTEELAIASSPSDTLTIASRAIKPYPPGLFRITNYAYPTQIIDQAVSIIWAHRDRLTQSDQVIDENDASIGPEAGTTYSVRLYNNDTSVLLNSADGLTGTSYSGFPSPTGNYNWRIELWSNRSGYASTYKHSWVFNYINVTYINTEALFRLTDEAGNQLTTE